ncbi:MAG: acyl-CoA/acyl-ACP dehydrogenase [Rhizobiaceae bacterium]|nr:acyl-CoA/acyl-ACP dehydrogenase [Rhizobiaceae bacterium]
MGEGWPHGPAFLPDYGGLGGSVIDLAIIAEEIAYTSADFFMAHAGGIFCELNIERKGNEAQKQKYLPGLIAGDLRMAISISEADAGSDIAAMKIRVVKTENGWRISGDKLWSTGSGVKDILLNVYLVTDPDVNPRMGMSLFLIPRDVPGVEIKNLDMLGRKSTGTYEIHFDNVEVPDEAIVGGINAGWDCVLSGFQVERITSAAGNIVAFGYSMEYPMQRQHRCRFIANAA